MIRIAGTCFFSDSPVMATLAAVFTASSFSAKTSFAAPHTGHFSGTLPSMAIKPHTPHTNPFICASRIAAKRRDDRRQCERIGTPQHVTLERSLQPHNSSTLSTRPQSLHSSFRGFLPAVFRFAAVFLTIRTFCAMIPPFGFPYPAIFCANCLPKS
jgi:hypothetical protein